MDTPSDEKISHLSPLSQRASSLGNVRADGDGLARERGHSGTLTVRCLRTSSAASHLPHLACSSTYLSGRFRAGSSTCPTEPALEEYIVLEPNGATNPAVRSHSRVAGRTYAHVCWRPVAGNRTCESHGSAPQSTSRSWRLRNAQSFGQARSQTSECRA